jgi:hypothetical protein
MTDVTINASLNGPAVEQGGTGRIVILPGGGGHRRINRELARPMVIPTVAGGKGRCQTIYAG